MKKTPPTAATAYNKLKEKRDETTLE